jgi:hypothetical protein
MMRFVVLLAIVMGPVASVNAQQPPPAKAGAALSGKIDSSKPAPIDLTMAKSYFAEARRLAASDGGKLWGKSLAGPMLFVDPRTRFAAANQADAEGKLKPEDGVFVGTLPANVPLANTATRWAGTHWSMLLWPPPSASAERAIMLMHESWHRIQADLGLLPGDPVNSQLDTRAGRYWLQLEWRALAKAMGSTGEVQRQAMEDALHFRQHRRSLFKGTGAKENALELHEGLAEYTGFKLSGLPAAEQQRLLIKHFETYPTSLETFVRSFIFLSGPAYGLLLDQHAHGWRIKVKSGDDLGLILGKALGLKMEPEPEAATEERAKRYGGEKLLAAEAAREESRRRQVAAFRRLLVDSPVLMLPLGKQQMSFNPSILVPIEDLGTVYPTITLFSGWGKLEVHKAALISADFKKAFVSAPTKMEEKSLAGDGWELRLEPGWKAVPGDRKGDWKLEKEK